MLLNMSSSTPLADAIKNEIHRKRMNFSIIITGRPQLRKSTIAIAIARSVNPGFSMQHDLAIIKTRDMLEALDIGVKRGRAKVLDELGVGMNHREWYSFLNQAMSYVMQTYAHEGMVVIVTAPYEDYVDKDAKMLFNMLIEMVKKNEREHYAMARITLMQYNQKTKKIYYKFPRGRFPDGTVKRVSLFKIKYPSDDVMDEYFKLSGQSKVELKKSLAREAVKVELKSLGSTFNPDDYIDRIRADPDKFVKEFHGRRYISREFIMNEFTGIGDTRARQIKGRAERLLNDELNLGKKYERKADTDAGRDIGKTE